MLLNKDSVISVVLPANATKLERFAGEELARYIETATGAAVSFSASRKENTLNFIIGSPERNSEAECIIDAQSFQRSVPGPEGIYLCVRGNDALIAGSVDGDVYDRGTLYAVYEFLERYVGCCFGAYSKAGLAAGETVPSHKALEIPDLEYVKGSADLTYRTAIVQYGSWAGNTDHALSIPFFDWLAKNRYNRILTWVSVYEQLKDLGLIPELEKRGIRLTVGHHQAIYSWLPPHGNQYFSEAYFEEHPEFFRLEHDGSRYVPKSHYGGQLILCSRNRLLHDVLAKNIISWIENNPIVDIIAFWPNDFLEPQCCCEECSRYSKTENYLYLENELARKITAVHPEIKIDVLIYQDLWKCPENAELCDGIIIDQSTWASPGLRKCGKPDGSGLIGQEYDRNLLEYRKVCRNVVLYEYYMGNYGNRQKIMPAADEMQSIFKHFKETGVGGSGTQLECFNLWNNIFNFYCFARTAYDTSLTLDAHISAFKALFGDGGEQIAEILRIYEETYDGQVDIGGSGDYFAHNVDRDRVYLLFERALDAAETASARNNIRLLRMAFRYTILTTIGETVDKNPEIQTYADPTGELACMASYFGSYLSDNAGYGIAIALKNRTDAPLPNDKWYLFE